MSQTESVASIRFPFTEIPNYPKSPNLVKDEPNLEKDDSNLEKDESNLTKDALIGGSNEFSEFKQRLRNYEKVHGPQPHLWKLFL